LLHYKHKQKVVSYENFNAVMGALESAKQEYYRRVMVPYEEEKIKQNGDILGFPERGWD
jgi:hypothetical protein